MDLKLEVSGFNKAKLWENYQYYITKKDKNSVG